MKIAFLNQINEGAVLGQDVLDDSGTVLMGAGTVLNGQNRDLLERRGIEMVTILDSSDEAPELNDIKPESEKPEKELHPGVVRRIKRVEHAFGLCRDNPSMETLRKLSLKWVAAGELRD